MPAPDAVKIAGQRPMRGDDDQAIVFGEKPRPPSDWWICDREEFARRLANELPRIQRSVISAQIRPMVLGGRLP